MLRLDSTLRKLQIVLAGAITTNQLPVVVCFSDKTSTTYNGSTTVSNTNSTTAVDICAAPGASTIRDIDSITVQNADTAAATVTIRYNDNGTTYSLFKCTLSVGDQIIYTHGQGWKVLDSSGALKSLSSSSDTVTLDGAQTLTNKTIALGSNTISGTTAEFNAALTDGNFTTLAGAEALTNKDITSTTNTVYANAGPSNTPFSHRNKIINGDFRVNQRDYVSGAGTSVGQYTLDRWKVTGTGGITFSTTDNKTTVTIPASQTIQQVIEGLNLQTGTYVLSWEGTAQGRIGGGSYGDSGAVSAAITGGTNTTIEFNTGTVTSVQLEIGTAATPVERRLIGMELELCQRYLPVIEPGTYIPSYARTTSTTFDTFLFPVTARVAPTGLSTTLSASIVYGNSLISAATAVSFAAASASGVLLSSTATGTPLTAGQGGLLLTNNKILFTGCEL